MAVIGIGTSLHRPNMAEMAVIGIGTNYALTTNMTCHRSVNSGHKWPPQAKAMREKRFKQRKNVGERKNVYVRIGARA
jgi:hypothetical protein